MSRLFSAVAITVASFISAKASSASADKTLCYIPNVVWNQVAIVLRHLNIVDPNHLTWPAVVPVSSYLWYR